jgi:hypothetical protein
MYIPQYRKEADLPDINKYSILWPCKLVIGLEVPLSQYQMTYQETSMFRAKTRPQELYYSLYTYGYADWYFKFFDLSLFLYLA